MSYMMIHGFCCNCCRPISFNPNHVPSLRVGGKREPLCRGCFTEWNRIHRTSQDLKPLPLHPDAYQAEEVSF